MSSFQSQVTLSSLFLVCGDRDRSKDFYENLGFRLTQEKSRSYILEAGRVELHLHDPLNREEEELYRVSSGPGSSSLVQSYETDNFDELCDRLPADAVLCPPHRTPWGQEIVLVQDPDGHRLEFRQRSSTQKP